MRPFLLISVLLHAMAAFVLHYVDANRDEPILPGRTIALTLQTLSEPERAPQTTPAPLPENIPAHHAPVPAVRETGTPDPARIEIADGEASAAAEKFAQPSQDEPDSQDTLNSLRTAVYSELHASFSYPRRARLRGWEGTVVISLRIMPDGQLSNLHVTDSSGIPVLDRAALRSLSQITVPRVVAWLDGREIDMLIPVEYRLTDG